MQFYPTRIGGDIRASERDEMLSWSDGRSVGLENHSQMTSAKFLGFWTPSLPLVGTKSTQPPFPRSEFGQLPPSPSLLTSFVDGPALSLARRN